MTKEEFLKKYGDIKVKFSSYYKYIFNYSATLEDGSILEVGVGGDSGDIYRFSVDVDELVRIEILDPFSGSVYKNGNEIEGFYE